MPRCRSAHGQHGVGTLTVSILLLLGVSIVAFYLNRSLLFEQKASANQMRSTAALEAAYAGVEWATGMLNRPNDISAACVPDTTTNQSFRKRYAQTNFGSNAVADPSAIVPATNVRPGCSMNTDGTLTCSCPAVPATGIAVAALTNATPLPGFTVSFAPVNTEALEVTSVGCSAVAGPCTAVTASAADATATVKAVLKLQPLLRAAPAAALTCGGSCSLSGSFNVVNRDLGSNGITVNSGTATTGGNQVITLPGVPPQNSIIANDPTLASIAASDPTCTAGRLFRTYFGTSAALFAAAPSTKTISCSNASDCGDQMNTAYGDGWRSFYFPAATGFTLNDSAPFNQLGTAADPVTLVTDGDLKLNGGQTVYGLIYSGNATNNNFGFGSSHIHGAVVACAAFDSSGFGTIIYDPSALKNAQRDTGLVLRVPGSWRDF